MQPTKSIVADGPGSGARIVLYCLLCRSNSANQNIEFLLIDKNGSLAFPPTKMRPKEDLYTALTRPMREDLGLPPGSYFPERELDMIPSSGKSHKYKDLPTTYHLYPVIVSLSESGWECLDKTQAKIAWMTLDDVLQKIQEPNIQNIAKDLLKRLALTNEQEKLDLKTVASQLPTMDAQASAWAAEQIPGVRIVHQSDVDRIIDAGGRAFNLRVADPYLPYQRQGLGFTWSFFTPKDGQDIHVHGLPAVEIYGVISGRLQLWFKPMNQRGVRTWQNRILTAGDWAEVEPLQCHFACWLDPEGLGTVIKAAGSGPLAGVGRLGVAGKTSCRWMENGKPQTCPSHNQCQIPPALRKLEAEYKNDFKTRDYKTISRMTAEALET